MNKYVVKKILLIPICGFGDSISYLPTVKIIRNKFPKAKIVAIVATDQARDIIEENLPGVQVVVFNRKKHGGFYSLLRLLVRIRHENFDLVMSRAPWKSLRIPLLAFFSGANNRIGAKSERLSFLYNKRIVVPEGGHVFERYRHLLIGAGIETFSYVFPVIQPSNEHKKSAMTIWAKAGFDRHSRVVGFVSGADSNLRGNWNPSLKRWNLEGYAKVARWLVREADLKVVMFGVSREASLAERIADLAGVKLVNLCGKTSLGELQWLIRECQVLVSNDTGTMHLSAALGTPVIALFGPTDPLHFGPLGSGHKIIQGSSECSPCYPRPTCRLTRCLAMDAIEPSSVIQSLGDKLV